MLLQVVSNMRTEGCAHVLQKMEKSAKDNSQCIWATVKYWAWLEKRVLGRGVER